MKTMPINNKKILMISYGTDSQSFSQTDIAHRAMKMKQNLLFKNIEFSDNDVLFLNELRYSRNSITITGDS